jgi:hypothetical protein
MSPDDTESNLDPSALGTGVHRTCQVCDTPFVPSPHHPHQRTCSRACQLASYRSRTGHVHMGTEIVGVCAGCGVAFTFLHRKRPRMRCPTCRSNPKSIPNEGDAVG